MTKRSRKDRANSSAPPLAAGGRGRWTIDARAIGDATVAQASLHDLLAIVITEAGKGGSSSLRSRAQELLADAYRAPDPPAGRHPIPPAMQRAIRSLVEWAEETQRDEPGASWRALILFHSESAPAAAHVGGEEPRLVAAGGVLTPQRLLLRGDSGGQARALCLRPGVLPAMSLTWSTEPLPGGGGTVEAEWLLEPREPEAVVPAEVASPSDLEPAADLEPAFDLEPAPEVEPTSDLALQTDLEIPADLETPADPAPAADPEPAFDLEPASEVEPTSDLALQTDLEILADLESPADPAPAADLETPADPAPAADLETSAEPVPAADLGTLADRAPAAEFATPAYLAHSSHHEPSSDTELWSDLAPSSDPAPSSDLAPSFDHERSSDTELWSDLAPSSGLAPSSDPAPSSGVEPPSNLAPSEGPAREFPDASEPSILDAILKDVDELPGGEFVVSHDLAAGEAEYARSSFLEELEDSRPGISWSSIRDEAPPPTQPPTGDDAQSPTPSDPGAAIPARDEPSADEPNIPWIEAGVVSSSRREQVAPVPGDAPPSLAPEPQGLDSASSIQEPQELDPSVVAATATAPGVPEQGNSGPSPAGVRRPARPLVVLGALGSAGAIATEADTHPNGTKRKRPRPRLARPHIAPSPKAEPPPPTQAPERQVPWWEDPKHRPALALGALVVVALIVWGRMLAGGGAPSPAADSQPIPTVVVPATGADSTVLGTGDVAIRATLRKNDDVTPVKGAQVWVDGQLRASVPATLALPIGPHSIRVNRHGEDSPVRMIDVAGGGLQVVNVEFGTDDDPPRLRLLSHEAPSVLDRVVTITVYLERVSNDDLQDMWLSLRDGGEWRRIPMSLLPAPGGTVGVAVLSAERLKPPHASPYYVIATRKSTGEHYYTEIQNSETP